MQTASPSPPALAGHVQPLARSGPSLREAPLDAMSRRGAVAAGHPLTAAAGAAVLREGGTAVDAAIAAVLSALVTESPITGLGAGGVLLVLVPGGEDVRLEFFVNVPGRARRER